MEKQRPAYFYRRRRRKYEPYNIEELILVTPTPTNENLVRFPDMVHETGTGENRIR